MFRSHRLVAGFVLACSSLAFANQGVVQIIEPGGHSFTVNAMNNHGVVVGHIFDQSAANHADRGHGFLWDGTMHILPDLGAGAEPTGINDNGDIIGVSYTYDPTTTIVTAHLASFTLTTVTDLGVTGVSTRNLTNAGDFAYMANDAQSHLRAYIRNFYSGATYEVATTLTNPNITEINSAGHMIGTSQTNLGWFDVGGGVVSMFAVFPPNPPAPYNSGRLNAIGEQDQLTGSGGNSERSTAFTYYFAWDGINGFSQIGTQVQINDYNAAGDAVGRMPNPNSGGTFQGIYYHNGVVSLFLDQMGPGTVSPTEVTHINDVGQAIISNPFGGGTWYFFDPALVTNFNPTMVLTGTGTFAYNGSPRVASATAHAGSSSALTPACIITYNPGDSTPPVLPGTYQVTAYYPGDDSKHLNPATATGTITITKLNSSTTATGGTFAYDGGPHPATYVVKTNLGVVIPGAVANITYTPGGTSIPVTPGTYSALVAFPGDAIYNPSSTSTVVKINNPAPTVAVTGGTFTYNGVSHPGTATVKDSLTNLVISNPIPTFTYNPGGSSVPVNAGTYQVTANYSGNATYPAASGTATIVIQQTATSVSVVGGTFIYDGNSHAATATAHDDSNNVDLSGVTISYSPGDSSAPVDAGTYQVTATYAGDANHSSSTVTGTIVIQAATTSVSVVGGSFTFDGNLHPATAAVHDDSNNVDLAVTVSITYSLGGSSAPVSPGSYLATAVFAGDAGHAGSSGSATITITQPMPNVLVNGGTFPYDGTAHAASSSVTDAATNQPIPGAVATITYYPGGSNPPVTPGIYAFTASFAGDATYPAASSSGTIVVNKADLYVSANNATKALNGAVPALSGSVSGVVFGDGIFAAYVTSATQSSPIGSYPITPVLSDPQGKLSYYNVYSSNGTLLVVYGGNTGILQPINADGTSVFKQKSTVPAKFRVYDANGNSVCAPGTVVSFYIVQTVNGTVTSVVNEAVDSTTPDDQFRCDGTQWIFNINTKNLSANVTYYFRVTLADGSTVDFHFGLK